MLANQTLAIGSDTKAPIFLEHNYEQWQLRFMDFIKKKDAGPLMVESILSGPAKFEKLLPGDDKNDPAILPQIVPKDPSKYTDEEKLRVATDEWALTYLRQGLTDDVLASIDSFITAKDVWDELARNRQSSDRGTRMKVTQMVRAYSFFKASAGESLKEVYDRYRRVLNDLSKHKIHKDKMDINIHFLSCLQPEWEKFADQLIQNKDLPDLTIHLEHLSHYEHRVPKKMGLSTVKNTEDTSAALVDRRSRSKSKKSKGKALIVSPSSSSESSDDATNQAIEEVRQQLALITTNFNKKFGKKSGSSSNRLRTSSNFKDKDQAKPERKEFKKPAPSSSAPTSTKQCYNCGKTGHFIKECRFPIKKDGDFYGRKALFVEQMSKQKALVTEGIQWEEETSSEEENVAFMADAEFSDSEDEKPISKTETSQSTSEANIDSSRHSC